MSKNRAKIQFVVELNALEITVPTQEAGKALVKKLNAGMKSAMKKALGLPKDAKLEDSGFSGVISGRIEGNEDAGFILDSFGAEDTEEAADGDSEEDDDDSDKENDDGNSKNQGVIDPAPIQTGGTEDPEPASTGGSGSTEPTPPATVKKRFPKKQK
jgi:hypothetical protein